MRVSMTRKEKLRFLTERQIRHIAETYTLPLFVYSREMVEENAQKALNFPHAYGLSVRYAMKANPDATLLKILNRQGIMIDASSEFEVERAILAGVKPSDILLTSQQIPKDFKKTLGSGVLYNACSLHQLEEYGKAFPGTSVSVRFNPGRGSGGTKKTDVGGPASSFGIWHHYAGEVQQCAERYNLTIERIHTHIGSGSDPDVWEAVSEYTLELVERFADVKVVNLGGGFKVGRMEDETSTDLQKIGKPVRKRFEDFYAETGRKLHLEIEPGTFLIALAGALVMEVIDKVDTGDGGYQFIKVNGGMDNNTRPSLYNARHPLVVVTKEEGEKRNDRELVVVGHCCESGDIFTVKDYGDPDPRLMLDAQIGDYVVMEGTGAYCASMSTKHYNSYPEAMALLLDNHGDFHPIRKPQSLQELLQNEITVNIS